MFRNGYMLDANAVLRFLLQDVEDQFRQVKNIIQKEKCYITLEVIAEVCYVLEGLYQVPRDEIADSIRRLNFDVVILNADVLLRALEKFAEIP